MCHSEHITDHKTHRLKGILQRTQRGRVPLFAVMVFNGDKTICEGTSRSSSSKRLPGPEQRRGAVCAGQTCCTSHKNNATPSPTHGVKSINSMKCMQRGPLRTGLGGIRSESSQSDLRRTSSGQRLAHGHTPCRVPTAQHLLFVPSFRVPPFIAYRSPSSCEAPRSTTPHSAAPATPATRCRRLARARQSKRRGSIGAALAGKTVY